MESCRADAPFAQIARLECTLLWAMVWPATTAKDADRETKYKEVFIAFMRGGRQAAAARSLHAIRHNFLLGIASIGLVTRFNAGDRRQNLRRMLWRCLAGIRRHANVEIVGEEVVFVVARFHLDHALKKAWPQRGIL